MTQQQFLLSAAEFSGAFTIFACMLSAVAELPRWADKAISHLKIEY